MEEKALVEKDCNTNERTDCKRHNWMMSPDVSYIFRFHFRIPGSVFELKGNPLSGFDPLIRPIFGKKCTAEWACRIRGKNYEDMLSILPWRQWKQAQLDFQEKRTKVRR